MTPMQEMRRQKALDAVFGTDLNRECCEALDRALHLLGARHDDARACLVLIAITDNGPMADAIAAAATRLDDLPTERGRLLFELHIELGRVRRDLWSCEGIDNAQRYERETAAYRERIAAIEAEIARVMAGRVAP